MVDVNGGRISEEVGLNIEDDSGSSNTAGQESSTAGVSSISTTASDDARFPPPTVDDMKERVATFLELYNRPQTRIRWLKQILKQSNPQLDAKNVHELATKFVEHGDEHIQSLISMVSCPNIWEGFTQGATKERTSAAVGSLLYLERGESEANLEFPREEFTVIEVEYFNAITEGCLGEDEKIRKEALLSLKTDKGLEHILSKLGFFIEQNVIQNISTFDGTRLKYLLDMLENLLENENSSFHRHVNRTIPTIITCVLCNADNLESQSQQNEVAEVSHMASKLMAKLCKSFGDTTNLMLVRVSRLYYQVLKDRSAPFSSLHGALTGLIELGPCLVRVYVLPMLEHLITTLEFTLQVTEITPAKKFWVQKALGLLKSLRNLDTSPEKIHALSLVDIL